MEEFGDIFSDNLARFGDFVTFLAKNECLRNFKTQVCKINRKRDTEEYSRNFIEIVYFARQALEDDHPKKDTPHFEL